MEIRSDGSTSTTSDIQAAIRVNKLSFRYRSFDDDADGTTDKTTSETPQAIENISFELPKGELLLIAGPSGCGKSTLLKCLNGLIPHSYKGTLTGEIYFAGRSTRGLSLRERARYIGTMLQDPDKQIIGNTVEQEIAFGMENLNTPRAEMHARIHDVLIRLHLEQYQKQATHALSGGQRQQIAAAGLLVMQPDIFLFDEPFANLDAYAVDILEDLITTLRQEGHTIILVEHRVEESLTLKPDKVLLIHEGKQTFFGSTEAFLDIADPSQIKLPVEVTLRSLEDRSVARDQLIQPIVLQKQVSETTKPILTFDNVHYRYSKMSKEILHGISFDVRSGETIALLGPNGSGKTTLVKQALGLLRPTKGSVRLYGEETRHLSVAQMAARIGYVFQSPGAMFFAPSVHKEISFGPENLRFSPEQITSSVRQTEEALNVAAFAERSPFSLSFGQQKRVAIASILAMQNKILLLDEPTAGQDYRSYIAFMEYLRYLTDLNTLLFITHDIDLALRYTQRVLLLKDGKLVADGPPLQVLADPELLTLCNLRPTSLLHYLLAQPDSVT